MREVELAALSPLHEDADEPSDVARAPTPRIGTLAALALPLYLPSTLFSMAKAITVPLVPLLARRTLGLDDRAIGVALSAQGVGKVACNFGSARAIAALGDRGTLLLGAGAMAAATLAIAGAPGGAALAAAEFAFGAALSLQQLGRQSWVRVAVADATRGRAMALLGTWARVASVLGPLVGGGVAAGRGPRAGLAAAPVLAALGGAAARAKMPATAAAAPRGGGAGYGEVVAHHSWPLATTALWGLLLFVLRTARDLAVPLAALELGCGPTAVAAVVAVSYGLDALVGAAAAGPLMDGCGRRAAGAASCAGFGLGFAALASVLFDDGLRVLGGGDKKAPRRVAGLYGAAALLGAANGASSGLVMTMSTDLAPEDLRGPFLAMFRVVSDTGIILGSFAVGAVSESYALHAACSGAAVLALATLAFLYCVVAETRPPPPAPPGDDDRRDAPSLLSAAKARVRATTPRARPATYAILSPDDDDDDGELHPGDLDVDEADVA